MGIHGPTMPEYASDRHDVPITAPMNSLSQALAAMEKPLRELAERQGRGPCSIFENKDKAIEALEQGRGKELAAEAHDMAKGLMHNNFMPELGQASERLAQLLDVAVAEQAGMEKALDRDIEAVAEIVVGSQ